MPSDFMFKAINCVHRAVFKASGGKLVNKGAGMPVLVLTTTGRTSGQARSTMLTSPLQFDGKVVIVASRGGDDRNPDWLLNLQATPKVEVEMAGSKRTMTAHIADVAEKADLWPKIIGPYPHYGGYQKKTERDIPVVVLAP